MDKLLFCCYRREKLMSSRTENGSDCGTDTDSRVLDSDTNAVSIKPDFMLIAENHEESLALCDGAAKTEVLHERNGDDVSAPLAASRHIATRSATGRLAKRPRKDLSPARSPARKIGMNFCSYVTNADISIPANIPYQK